MRRLLPLKPEFYFRIVPALFFGSLGAYDIIADAISRQLTLQHFLFNALLLIPLLVSHRYIQLLAGALLAILSLYGMFVCFIFLCEYWGGRQFRHEFATVVAGPLLTSFSFLCSMSLILASRKKFHRQNSSSL